MNKIDRVLKKLSDLYEFKRKLKGYHLKEEAAGLLKEDTPKERRVPQAAQGRQ